MRSSVAGILIFSAQCDELASFYHAYVVRRCWHVPQRREKSAEITNRIACNHTFSSGFLIEKHSPGSNLTKKEKESSFERKPAALCTDIQLIIQEREMNPDLTLDGGSNFFKVGLKLVEHPAVTASQVKKTRKEL